MINYPEIYWTEQCKYCYKALNTSHCVRNKGFMKKLQDMHKEYLGTVEFECDYFSLDHTKAPKNNEIQS